MTSRGKLQRIRAADISVIGRNTQGVRIMSLDEGDTLTAVVRVPKEEGDEVEGEAGQTADGEAPAAETPTSDAAPGPDDDASDSNDTPDEGDDS